MPLSRQIASWPGAAQRKAGRGAAAPARKGQASGVRLAQAWRAQRVRSARKGRAARETKAPRAHLLVAPPDRCPAATHPPAAAPARGAGAKSASRHEKRRGLRVGDLTLATHCGAVLRCATQLPSRGASVQGSAPARLRRAAPSAESGTQTAAQQLVDTAAAGQALRHDGGLCSARACAPHAAESTAARTLAPLRIVLRHVAAEIRRLGVLLRGDGRSSRELATAASRRAPAGGAARALSLTLSQHHAGPRCLPVGPRAGCRAAARQPHRAARLGQGRACHRPSGVSARAGTPAGAAAAPARIACMRLRPTMQRTRLASDVF